jgi:hypothetical protein
LGHPPQWSPLPYDHIWKPSCCQETSSLDQCVWYMHSDVSQLLPTVMRDCQMWPIIRGGEHWGVQKLFLGRQHLTILHCWETTSRYHHHGAPQYIMKQDRQHGPAPLNDSPCDIFLSVTQKCDKNIHN